MQENSYYSCALWNGRLEVRVDAGRGTVSLQSGGLPQGPPEAGEAPLEALGPVGPVGALNDGRLHTVSVVKTGRRIELRVDDVLQSTATLPEGATVVRAPGGAGGLYWGGVPAAVNVSDMLATTMPFIGTIKDAIFNDE